MPEPGKPEVEVVDAAAASDPLEQQLNVEEDIERRTSSEHHEAPHFKKEVD
jgi:hypothetical protein